MAATTMLVTGSWLKPDNTAPLGYVEFTPLGDRYSNGGMIVLRETVRAPLSAAGTVSVTLVRCASGYTVKEVIDGVGAASYVLADSAGPVDLSTVS